MSTFSWESSPSSGPAGETDLTMGGAPVGISGGPLYAVTKLSFDTFGNLCGGRVGSGLRMCVRTSCSVAAHQIARNKMVWEELVGATGESECVVIMGEGSEKSCTTVFLSPVLMGSKVPNFEEMELSPRPLVSWQALFQSLQQNAEPDQGPPELDLEVKAKLFKDTAGVGVSFAITPKKKRKTDSGSDGPEWKVLRTDLGGSSAELVGYLARDGGWTDTVGNMESLKASTQQVSAGLREAEAEREADSQSVDLKLALLSALVGDRPASFGTQGLFSVVEDMSEGLVELQQGRPVGRSPAGFGTMEPSIQAQVVARLQQELPQIVAQVEAAVQAKSGAWVDTGVANYLENPVSGFQVQFVQPVLNLLRQVSSGPAAVGDLLDQRLASLEGKVLSLEALGSSQGIGVGGLGGTSGGGSVFSSGWGTTPVRQSVPTVGLQPAAAGVSGVSADFVKELVKEVREELDQVRDQVEAKSVDVGRFSFKSQKDCQQWLATNNAAPGVFHFLDAISLLSLATSDVHDSEKEAADQRATSVKIRDGSIYETAFIGSYSLEVPPLLGRGTNPDTTSSSRTLPAVPRFEDFHPGHAMEGVKDRLLKYVKDFVQTMNAMLSESFTRGSDPHAVATVMVDDSKAFWDSFCTWIVQYYEVVKGRSSGSSKEVWALISHCVRAVFGDLREARAPGRGLHTPGGMFWGALQAHRVMAEYRKVDFSGHPRIALILHEHLINFSVPMSKFEELEKSLSAVKSELSDKLDKAVRLANQANAAANAAANKNRGGGGGGSKT
mgnify:CR=1 FL=1